MKTRYDSLKKRYSKRSQSCDICLLICAIPHFFIRIIKIIHAVNQAHERHLRPSDSLLVAEPCELWWVSEPPNDTPKKMSEERNPILRLLIEWKLRFISFEKTHLGFIVQNKSLRKFIKNTGVLLLHKSINHSRLICSRIICLHKLYELHIA